MRFIFSSISTPSQPPIIQHYNFALIICKHPRTNKYLLVQEFGSQGFWCPGGAVDPMESLTEVSFLIKFLINYHFSYFIF